MAQVQSLVRERLHAAGAVKKKKNQRRKKKTMRLTSAVFLPALAMNIDLILFGFVTTVFLTFLLSLFRALSSFPVGRELI